MTAMTMTDAQTEDASELVLMWSLEMQRLGTRGAMLLLTGHSHDAHHDQLFSSSKGYT